jgi:hypothetical protein
VSLNVAGKQMSNGALAVAGGLVVGLVDTFLPWHTTTFPTVLGSQSGGHDALGYRSGWVFFLAVGGYLMRTEPQPATMPPSAYQSPSSPSTPPPPPAPPAPST